MDRPNKTGLLRRLNLEFCSLKLTNRRIIEESHNEVRQNAYLNQCPVLGDTFTNDSNLHSI